MHKNGLILLLILLCLAFLVSCAKKDGKNLEEQGELVKTETEGMIPSVLQLCLKYKEGCQEKIDQYRKRLV